MTMDVVVYALTEVDHRQLFARALMLAGGSEATRVEDLRYPSYEPGPNEPGREGDPRAFAVEHESYAKLAVYSLYVNYRPGRALRDRPEGGYGPAWAEVSIGLSFPNRGAQAARIISGIGDWLDSRHVRWSWSDRRDDFAGREGLAELAKKE